MAVCWFFSIYIYIYIYIVQFDGNSKLVSRHNKFISAENITILPVSSDDFLHAFLEVAEKKMWNYSSYSENKIKGWQLTKFESPSNCTIYALNVNFVIPQRINRGLTIAIYWALSWIYMTFLIYSIKIIHTHCLWTRTGYYIYIYIYIYITPWNWAAAQWLKSSSVLKERGPHRTGLG